MKLPVHLQLHHELVDEVPWYLVYVSDRNCSAENKCEVKSDLCPLRFAKAALALAREQL